MAWAPGPEWTRAHWETPYWLRFELNPGSPSHLTMFKHAFDRARALTRAALSHDDQVMGIIAGEAIISETTWGYKEFAGANAFDLLEKIGAPTSRAVLAWSDYLYPGDVDDDEMKPVEHRAVRLDWDQADVLLWNQVAKEMGVSPTAPLTSKLIDMERGVSVYAYDDRGMDITALSRDTIAPLYEQFDAWLLDYDRPRMAAIFGR